MSLLVNLYDSASLTEAVNLLKVPEPFVLKNIFKTIVPNDTDTILFEEYSGSDEIAQFVHLDDPSPTSVKKTTRKAKSFQLPRTFENKVFTPQELSKINAIGQIFADENVRLEEQQKAVARELEELKNRVIRRREQMACAAIATGKITVSQGNIDFEYDFDFEATKQLVTYTSTALWTNAASSPIANINEWKKKIAKRSGVAVRHILLGTSAAEAFLKHAEIQKALDTNNYKMGQLDLTNDATGSATLLGRIAGVNIWEYSQQYTAGGSSQEMIAVDRAIAVGDSPHFKLHYGPAYRIENGVAVPIISDMYLEVDPSSDNRGLQWNLEQKSLPVVHDKGCVISVKVV